MEPPPSWPAKKVRAPNPVEPMTRASVAAEKSVAKGHNIRAVFFCFYAPNGANAKSGLSRLINGFTSFMSEEYTHTECLFLFEGDVEDKKNWRALSVNERAGSGLYHHDINYYRDGRWAVFRLECQLSVRQALYTFAQKENRQRRQYNIGSLVSTQPVTRCCMPVVRYTPGCSACMPTGPRTVFCVELLIQMLKSVYPDKFDDICADSMRADAFLSLIEERLPVKHSMLTLDAECEKKVYEMMLSNADALWSPPE